jgi:hypothetical protein
MKILMLIAAVMMTSPASLEPIPDPISSPEAAPAQQVDCAQLLMQLNALQLQLTQLNDAVDALEEAHDAAMLATNTALQNFLNAWQFEEDCEEYYLQCVQLYGMAHSITLQAFFTWQQAQSATAAARQAHIEAELAEDVARNAYYDKMRERDEFIPQVTFAQMQYDIYCGSVINP